MSKDTQESSPIEQRKSLVEYAKSKGYKVVGEYVDEGISGDATEKRLAFIRMISDCKSKRFELILCWDQDRFGRFDPLEAGYWIKPMRDAGVILETIAQGRVDWSDFAGRIIWSVAQESKHAFLKDLARNSLRGTLARAKTGRFTGRAPYGYEVGEEGFLIRGEPTQVEAVKRVFELRTLRLGYRLIAVKMNEENHPSPGGNGWSPDGVRLILDREAYMGTLVYGRSHRGKYSTSVDGTVSPAVGGRNIKNPSPVRVVNAHPAIIDQDIWMACREITRDVPKPHASRGRSGAPLAGLLRCGLCGSLMYSQSLQRKAGQKWPNYICGGYMLSRKCGYCFVPQAKAHEIVRSTICELFGSPDELAQMMERFAMSTEQKPDESTSRISNLHRLNKQIEVATGRLLTVNERLFQSLQAKLLEMTDERDRIQMESRTKPRKQMDFKLHATALWSAANEMETLDPIELRAKLKEIIDFIRFDFRIGKQTKRGQSYDFLGGEIIWKQSSEPCVSLTTATSLNR